MAPVSKKSMSIFFLFLFALPFFFFSCNRSSEEQERTKSIHELSREFIDPPVSARPPIHGPRIL